MNRWRWLAAATSLALLIACAPRAYQLVRPEPRNAVPGFVLDGTWEGSLIASTTGEAGAPITFPVHLRVKIRGGKARVYARDSADLPWKECAPEGFVLDAYGTNAVIYANRAGRIDTPEGSRWFETYLVAASVRAPNELQVHWMRMVTNLDVPADSWERSGTSAGDGVLLRK